LYINADFVSFSSWYKRFLDETDLNDAESLSYALVNGYSTLDLTARYYFGKTFSAFIKGTNIFDVPYGGINATGFDIDMRYTPQAGRNIHLGLSINMK
jgi:outer membrane receptor protein involved in Fe transport